MRGGAGGEKGAGRVYRRLGGRLQVGVTMALLQHDGSTHMPRQVCWGAEHGRAVLGLTHCPRPTGSTLTPSASATRRL